MRPDTGALPFQKRHRFINAAGIARQAFVCAGHPMAWNDNRNSIAAHGIACCLCRHVLQSVLQGFLQRIIKSHMENGRADPFLRYRPPKIMRMFFAFLEMSVSDSDKRQQHKIQNEQRRRNPEDGVDLLGLLFADLCN